jgi:hypothetical protein
MGPKKKMAKGGAVAKPSPRKPSGRVTSDDVKRLIPTGRSAAARKAAMKGTKGGRNAFLMGSIMKGSGNPAGKDMSIAGKLRGALSKMSRQRASTKRQRLGPQGRRKNKK